MSWFSWGQSWIMEVVLAGWQELKSASWKRRGSEYSLVGKQSSMVCQAGGQAVHPPACLVHHIASPPLYLPLPTAVLLTWDCGGQEAVSQMSQISLWSAYA